MKNFKFFFAAAVLAASVLAAFPGNVPAQEKGPGVTYKDWLPEAQKGDSEKAFMVGLAYYYSMYGAPKDNSKARQWFMKASAAGSARASTLLGDMYYFGRGVKTSRSAAFKWYAKGAPGDYESAERLGDMYYYGESVKRNYPAAVKWYRKAAESARGPSSAFKLGSMYLLGEGLKANCPEAFKWFSKAASMGSREAPVYLSNIYRSGQCVKKSKTKAAEWLLIGAERGDIAAMRALGEAHYSGDGVAKSNVEAYKWLAVVTASIDEPSAKKLLSKVMSRMSSAELNRAKRDASPLIKKYAR